MPDVTMCRDDGCPRARSCRRHEDAPGERQSYFAGSPREGEECEHYWWMPGSILKGMRCALHFKAD